MSVHLAVGKSGHRQQRLGLDHGPQFLVSPPDGPQVGKAGHFQRLGVDHGPQRLVGPPVGPPVGKSGHFQRLGVDRDPQCHVGPSNFR